MFFVILLLGIISLKSSFSITTMLSPLEPQRHVGAKFVKFLTGIKAEQNIEAILMLRRGQIECSIDHAVFQANVPRILVSNIRSFHLMRNIGSNLLTIVCLEADFDSELLDLMSRYLQQMRQTRIVILATDATQPDAVLRPLLLHCDRDSLTNVLVLFEDFVESGSFYRIHPFPTFTASRVVHANTSLYYPRQWCNMQGRKLITMPDNVVPRSLWFIDSYGRHRLSGYVAQTIELFAEVYNATLHFYEPSAVGQIAHPTVLMNWTRDRILDIPMSIIGADNEGDWVQLSYPLEATKWLVIVPCAEPLPTWSIYTMIVERRLLIRIVGLVFVLSALHVIIEKQSRTSVSGRQEPGSACRLNVNLVVNDKIIPGILGQTFILPASSMLSLKLLYMIIFLLGLILNTLFAAHLKTLLTSHPDMQQVSNFDEMRQAKLKLLLDGNEIIPMKNCLSEEFYASIEDIIEVTDTKRFQHQRMGLVPTHAYSITTSLWSIFKEQQKYFKRGVFCTTPSMELNHQLSLAFPVGESSMFRDPLNELLLVVHEVGLLSHWQMRTYCDMLAMGLISIEDMSKDITTEAIAVMDLHYVWLLLAVGLTLGTVAFSGELFSYWVQQRTDTHTFF